MQHALVAQVCAHVAGERLGGVFPRNHDERRLGRMGEPRRHHEWPRRRGNAQRGVLPRIEFPPERLEGLGVLEDVCQRINEHTEYSTATVPLSALTLFRKKEKEAR